MAAAEMKSPFPGMDPFIEASGLWGDFHSSLIEAIHGYLGEALPPRYVARTGQRAFVEEEFRESFVDVLDAENAHKLVACIEVLSPANKQRESEGWGQFLRKRQAILSGKAHWIEIDLLRGGERKPMIDDWPDSPYYLLLARRATAPVCKVWPAFSTAPLPVVALPLLKPDPDISLDLQPMLDAIYQRSRYFLSIDYAQDSPGLNRDETELLKPRAASRRGKKP